MVAAGLSDEDMGSQSGEGTSCCGDRFSGTVQIEIQPTPSFRRETGRAELLTRILPQDLEMRQSHFSGRRARSEAATCYYLSADGAGDGLVPAQLHLVGEEVEGV